MAAAIRHLYSGLSPGSTYEAKRRKISLSDNVGAASPERAEWLLLSTADAACELCS